MSRENFCLIFSCLAIKYEFYFINLLLGFSLIMLSSFQFLKVLLSPSQCCCLFLFQDALFYLWMHLIIYIFKLFPVKCLVPSLQSVLESSFHLDSFSLNVAGWSCAHNLELAIKMLFESFVCGGSYDSESTLGHQPEPLSQTASFLRGCSNPSKPQPLGCSIKFPSLKSLERIPSGGYVTKLIHG